MKHVTVDALERERERVHILKENKIVGANASVCPNTTKTCPKKLGNRLDQPNAITLVALIITIIILIILAGVTLNLALGQNGIFVKSKQAVDKYKDESQKEQNTLENIYQDMNTVTGGENEKEDYSMLKVGDYVNYPVEYDNVPTYSYVSEGVCKDETNPEDNYASKWRIISIDTEKNEVKLISAGVPLNYYHGADFNQSVKNLTTDFFKTEIKNDSTPEQYQFFKSGFKSENKESILTTIEQVKKLFINDLTKRVNEIPEVRSMKLEDFNTMWDSESSDNSGYYLDDKYKSLIDLLFVPRKENIDSHSATDWIVSEKPSYNDNYMWHLCLGEFIGYGWGFGGVCGVRPVVTLKSNVKFTKANTDTNDTTTWDIAAPENP